MRRPKRFQAPGSFRGAPRGAIAGHHEVEVIVRGRGAFRRDDRWLPVVAGDVLWWRPGETVHARVDPAWSDDPYACVVFAFAPSVEPPPVAFCSHWQPSAHAVAFAEEAMRAHVRAEGSTELLNAHCYHTLLWRCLATRGTAGGTTANSRANDTDPLSAAEGLIERDYHRDLGVNDLAAAARISSGHLHELFRQRRGTTPMGALWERRLQQVREELVATSKDLESVARSCGFSGSAHLCRRFKARFAITPGSLRRTYHTREA